MSWLSDKYKQVTGNDAPAQGGSDSADSGFFSGWNGGIGETPPPNQGGQSAFAPKEMTPEEKSQARIANLQKIRTKEATDFRTNLPGYQSDMTQNLMGQERQNLSNQMAQTKYGASRRGLLNSGMQKGEEAKLAGQSKSDVYKGVQTIGQSLNDQADQMAQSAIQGGMDYWKSGQAIQDTAYSNALQAMQTNRANLSGALSFAGSLAGNYAGNSGYSSNTNYDPSGNPYNKKVVS